MRLQAGINKQRICRSETYEESKVMWQYFSEQIINSSVLNSLNPRV
jgi:hypothetical protein